MPAIDIEISKNIVNRLKTIIEYDINFIDTQGVIVASTDEDRVGSIHYGALDCLREKRTIVIRSDSEYPGSRSGINMPIHFNRQIVGVIGITGDPDQVSKYGELIRQMTEILIAQNWLQITNSHQLMLNKIIIEQLINKIPSDFEIPIELAQSDRHSILVAKAKDDSSFLLENNFLIDSFSLGKRFKLKSIFGIYYDELIIITGVSDQKEIVDEIERIRDYFDKHYSIDLCFGVSDPCEDFAQMHKAYRDAKSCVRWIQTGRPHDYLFYKDMTMGVILASIPKSDITEFINRTLGALTPEEVEYYRQIFLLYTNHNGSLKHCAAALYIHRNTLQYQLNRLKDLTGLDPRNLEDHVSLYLAFKLLQAQ